jgi:hypothetical protein
MRYVDNEASSLEIWTSLCDKETQGAGQNALC